MSIKKLKPWEERGWVCGKVLASGNQGRVYLARKAVDLPDQFNSAIKLLIRNNLERSRTAFAAEAAMLQILSHPGIPSVIDTNANEFKGGADLYLVMPYINGKDLEALTYRPTGIKSLAKQTAERIEDAA